MRILPIDVGVNGRIDETGGEYDVNQQKYYAKRKSVLNEPQVQEGWNAAPVCAQKWHGCQYTRENCNQIQKNVNPLDFFNLSRILASLSKFRSTHQLVRRPRERQISYVSTTWTIRERVPAWRLRTAHSTQTLRLLQLFVDPMRIPNSWSLPTDSIFHRYCWADRTEPLRKWSENRR